MTKWSPHLVRLCGLVEHASVDGSSHQVVGGRDGVNVASEMEVELKRTNSFNKGTFTFVFLYKQHSFSSTSSIGMT